MSLPGLAYPLLGLADSLPRRETWDWFWDVEDFSICESWRLKARPEMLIVDSEGRCWRISSVRDLGVAGNFRTRVLRFLVRQSLHRLDQVLVPLPSMTFGDFQRRLCAAIQNNPDYWRDDEAIAGEDGQPRDVAGRPVQDAVTGGEDPQCKELRVATSRRRRASLAPATRMARRAERLGLSRGFLVGFGGQGIHPGLAGEINGRGRSRSATSLPTRRMEGDATASLRL